MARSRNERIGRRIGKAIISGNLTSAGTMVASGVGTTVHSDFDSTGALLNSDSSSYSDGSLHYLSKLRKMYMWDDSDGQFFLLTGVDSDAAAGTPTFAGSSYGYTAGNYTENAGGAYPPTTRATNVIVKYSFSSDGNASDVGDMTSARGLHAGQSSSDNGYTSGGMLNNSLKTNIIDKFPFTTDGNSSDVGDLTITIQQVSGQSSSSNGYSAGGRTPTNQNVIQKHSFSADGNATDVGDLTTSRGSSGGNSSSSDGYAADGTAIDKFPFASDANAVDIGNLTHSFGGTGAASSSTHGYNAGGEVFPFNVTNIIDKFSFSSDGNATDVGDIGGSGSGILGRSYPAGSSSTASGYMAGGRQYHPSSRDLTNIIDKFPFATDANASDVGDLTGKTMGASGHQV